MNEFVARTGIISKNNAIVSGSLFVTNGVTASLYGTASISTIATTSLSSSWASSSLSASYLTGYTVPITVTSSISSSYASSSLSSSYSLTSSYAILSGNQIYFTTSSNTAMYVTFTPNTGSQLEYLTSSLTFNPSTGVFYSPSHSGSFTGSLLGTASYANIAVTASYFSGSISNAITASYSNFSNTASAVILGSGVTNQPYYIDFFSSWTGPQLGYASNGFTFNPITNTISGSGLNITASLYGSSSYSTTASYSNQASSSNYALTASYAFALNGLPINNTQSILVSTASFMIVNQINTGSYVSAFFDYAVISASINLRSGTIFGGWLPNNSSSYTEYSVVDIGNTSDITMSMLVTQSTVQLLAYAATTPNWSVRSLGRFL